MKKLLATLAALAALAALAIGVGSLGWRPSTRAGPPRLERAVAGIGELSAGVADHVIALPEDVSIAGFPRLRGWRSDGVRDDVHVRALVLSEPGASIALVSAEILLVPAPLARAVEAKVKDLGLDHVVLAGTHTHAGPGGYWKDPIAERVALGPYDAAFTERLVQTIADVIRAAAAAKEPATIAAGAAQVDRLVRNRAKGEVDGRLVVMRVGRRAGGTLAAVVLYPAHPTILGSANEAISGDWPGALASESSVPLLFFQGALGDQSARPPHGRDQVERYARRVQMAVDRVKLDDADPAPPLAVATATAVLPPPDLGATPTFLKRLTKNVLYGWFPDRARVAAIRLGPLTLLAIPGEPVAEVGKRWRGRTGSGAEILSLANDYLGYVETSERMADRGGETVRTYYGPELAERLGAAVDVGVHALQKALAERDMTQNRTAGAPASVQTR